MMKEGKAFQIKLSGIQKAMEWKKGEWDNEPDFMVWIDTESGYLCQIRRNGALGNLCGYVGIKEGHPSYGKHYFEMPDEIEVHGGLTYADKANTEGWLIPTDETDNTWFFGFDCAHSYDEVPCSLMPFFQEYATYKNISYVKNECKKLADQLKLIEDGKM